MEFSHYSVLLNECIEALNIAPDGIYVDGTASGAGHSREIAKRLTTGRLIAIDKDPDAIAAATERLAPYPCAQVVQGDFADMDRILAELEIPRSMESCWIWEYPPISWTGANGDFPTMWTRRWICA